MNNSYKRGLKEKAKALHIQGASFARIANEIGCNRKTVSKWSRDEGWLEEEAKVYYEGTALATQQASILMSNRITQQVEAYQEMLSKGVQALQQTQVKSAGEAGQLIDKAIRGMGAIQEDYVRLSFIQEIAMVLKSEIQDKDLLSRIAKGLREVYQENGHHKADLLA